MSDRTSAGLARVRRLQKDCSIAWLVCALMFDLVGARGALYLHTPLPITYVHIHMYSIIAAVKFLTAYKNQVVCIGTLNEKI